MSIRATTPATFHRFGDLSAELHVKIFSHAIDDLRPLRLWCAKDGLRSIERAGGGGLLISNITADDDEVLVMNNA